MQIIKLSRPSLKTSFLIGGLFLCSSGLSAGEFNLRISDDTIHGNVAVDNSDSNAEFGLGYLYKDDDATNILNVDLHTKGRTAIANMPTTVGIGFEGSIFKEDEFKGSAIGIGANVRVNLPDIPGLQVETGIHYAPSVLAFGDSDEFRSFRLQLNYRIIESADIGLGYRYLNVGVEETDENHTFESGAFLGLKITF